MTATETTSNWSAPDVPFCEKCALQHLQVWVKKDGTRSRSCKAHRTQRDPETGALRPCAAPPMKGQDICKDHGGRSKQAQRAAQRRLEAKADREAKEKALRKAAQIFGVPREVDPAQGLIESYWRSAGLVDAYERLIRDLGPDDLQGGVISERTKVTRTELPESAVEHLAGAGVDDLEPATETEIVTTRGARKHPLVKLFDEERDRFEKLGIEIVKLELEVRRDEYVRAQVDVFANVLGQLELTDDQRLRAARLLRELDGRPRVVDGHIV